MWADPYPRPVARGGIWVCYDATPDGNPGFTVTGGVGAGPTIGAGVSVGGMISNGHALSDQGKGFTYGEGSVGEGPASGGGSVAVGKNAQGKTIYDVGGAWTPGVGDGVVVQGGRSYTWTFPSN